MIVQTSFHYSIEIIYGIMPQTSCYILHDVHDVNHTHAIDGYICVDNLYVSIHVDAYA